MITELSSIDKIEVLEDGQIQVRRADKVLRDDVEIAKSYHRHVLSPGDDLTGQDAKVAAVAITVWTHHA
jgi:urease accessory protein UreE